jgi:hypothetical protein
MEMLMMMLQYKRNTDVIRGPYNANRQSLYVELVLVVDNKEYKELGESREKVNHHCKEIANIINAVSDKFYIRSDEIYEASIYVEEEHNL